MPPLLFTFLLQFNIVYNQKCKLIKRHLLSIVAGKVAVFKAMVTGTPTPKVTWSRANGEIHFHPNVCLQKYDEASREHTLEVSFSSVNDHKGDKIYFKLRT